jgi:tetratricopeptide (TPR) repeat protein
VRVTAQLIVAETGAHLWADRFDGELEEIFDMHDRVATEVVIAIEPNLRHAEIERSLRKPTASLDAYDFYMRASAAFTQPTGRNLRAALDFTQQAITRDPRFARALALRALCIMHSLDSFGPDAVPEALRLAHAALATSSDDSEATSFAAVTIALLGGSIETALTASESALMLSPNGFSAVMCSGWIQTAAGHPNEAIDMFKRALRLSPRDPFRGYTELGLAIAYRDTGHPKRCTGVGTTRYPDAARTGRRLSSGSCGARRSRPSQRSARYDPAIAAAPAPCPHRCGFCAPPEPQ